MKRYEIHSPDPHADANAEVSKYGEWVKLEDAVLHAQEFSRWILSQGWKPGVLGDWYNKERPPRPRESITNAELYERFVKWKEEHK